MLTSQATKRKRKRAVEADAEETVQPENIDDLFRGEEKPAEKSAKEVAAAAPKISLSQIKLGADHFVTKEGELSEAQVKAPAKKKSRDAALPEWILAPQKIDDKDRRNLDTLGLDANLLEALQKMKIEQLFPVQSAVIPTLLRMKPNGQSCWATTRDVCVCAPTGSGKTLAYAIPIVQSLITRVVRRLRAVVLLPSRDLAVQVHSVFEELCQTSDLRVGVIVGQSVLKREIEELLGDARRGLGVSRCDILIATPGRLIEHLMHTPNFSLEHLEYLVIDEADRLMAQSYQDWANLIEKSTAKLTPGEIEETSTGRWEASCASARMHNNGREGGHTVSRVHKLLFSATLSKNPQQLAAMNLKNPLFLTAGESARFTTPKRLGEFIVTCGHDDKPLVLLTLLHQHVESGFIIFTGSVESTHRLYRLIEIYGDVSVAEFSSALHQNARAAIVERFRAGKIRVIICSDVMSRGMDFGTADIVVNYDAPQHIQTYIHRVGRTARAGRHGRCYTLCVREELSKFKNLLRRADNNFALQIPLGSREYAPYVDRYQMCLNRLKEVTEAERRHDMDASKPVPPSFSHPAPLPTKVSTLLKNMILKSFDISPPASE